MPFGEMTVTLHDVWYILRVPIGGTTLLPNPDVKPHNALAEYLGYKTKADLRLPIGLKEVFRVPWMKSGAVHVRGLIARVDSMRDVSAAKMFLFSLLDEITKYAWGTAPLAWLYMQLGTATRADIVGCAGCLPLLQSWIHEYFLHTRKSVVHPEPRREGEPLCGRWASTDAIASGLDGRDKRLAYYRRLLDSLESEDVTWLPFGTGPAERVPYWTFKTETDLTFRSVIRFSDIAEHYDPMCALRQLGILDGLHPMLADPGGLPVETMEELCTCVHDIYVDFHRQRPPRPFYLDEEDDDE
ncbi:Protein MAINTENANCE OF MERISTEMS [Linum grandiflorum]